MEGPASLRSFGVGVDVGRDGEEAEEEAGSDFTLLRAWEMARLMKRAATALSTTVVRATKETISSVRSFIRSFSVLLPSGAADHVVSPRVTPCVVWRTRLVLSMNGSRRDS